MIHKADTIGWKCSKHCSQSKIVALVQLPVRFAHSLACSMRTCHVQHTNNFQSILLLNTFTIFPLSFLLISYFFHLKEIILLVLSSSYSLTRVRTLSLSSVLGTQEAILCVCVCVFLFQVSSFCLKTYALPV